MTADFFVFGQFDQKTKNKKWNELDIAFFFNHFFLNLNFNGVKAHYFNAHIIVLYYYGVKTF